MRFKDAMALGKEIQHCGGPWLKLLTLIVLEWATELKLSDLSAGVKQELLTKPSRYDFTSHRPLLGEPHKL